MVFVMFGVDLEEWLYNIFVFVLKGIRLDFQNDGNMKGSATSRVARGFTWAVITGIWKTIPSFTSVILVGKTREFTQIFFLFISFLANRTCKVLHAFTWNQMFGKASFGASAPFSGRCKLPVMGFRECVPLVGAFGGSRRSAYLLLSTNSM